ncbi:MAG: glutathione peroxidase [Phycisphaerales bacterium]
MTTKMLIASVLLAGLGFAAMPAFAQDKAPDAAKPKESAPEAAAPKAAATKEDVLARKMNDIEGKEQDLSQYKGKVVLVVNVASKCGYTYQYTGLEALYQKYKDRGLVILGFPANNFAGQEPGSSDDIKKVCFGKYKVSFPMFEKISVEGADQHALYKAIASASPTPKEPQWNFTKYLLNRKGEVVNGFESRVKPDDASLARAIEDLLGPDPKASAAPEAKPAEKPADKK